MRKLIAAVLAAGSLGVLAAPALAGNSGTPPGPPEISGGVTPTSAFVLHCQAAGGGSMVVFNNSRIHGHGAPPCP